MYAPYAYEVYETDLDAYAQSDYSPKRQRQGAPSRQEQRTDARYRLPARSLL
jgi:hypothetical protein